MSICRATKRFLCFLGFDAVTFLTGQEFIDTLDGTPSFDPDCVILDIQMPGLNGFQVQERLTGSHRNIPVIFLTAFDEVWIREQALAAGAAAFLSKPCSSALLLETLRAVLKLSAVSEP
jgi:FixJ family two-component response regulator